MSKKLWIPTEDAKQRISSEYGPNFAVTVDEVYAALIEGDLEDDAGTFWLRDHEPQRAVENLQYLKRFCGWLSRRVSGEE